MINIRSTVIMLAIFVAVSLTNTLSAATTYRPQAQTPAPALDAQAAREVMRAVLQDAEVQDYLHRFAQQRVIVQVGKGDKDKDKKKDSKGFGSLEKLCGDLAELGYKSMLKTAHFVLPVVLTAYCMTYLTMRVPIVGPLVKAVSSVLASMANDIAHINAL